jgi:hypothetical protein
LPGDGFSVYLIGIFSLRGASISLWMFFAIQWGVICTIEKPLRFVNPFGWAHGYLSFCWSHFGEPVDLDAVSV